MVNNLTRAHQYLNSNIKVASRTSQDSFGCAGLKFRFLDFKIWPNENGWSRPNRDGTVLLSNPLSLSRYNIPFLHNIPTCAALAWTNLSSLHFSGKSSRQCLLSFIESHIKPWLAFWWSHFISDEPNHSLHGNPNIFLENCHFQSKTFDGYHKAKGKKSMIEFAKKEENSILASWEQTVPAGSDNLW